MVGWVETTKEKGNNIDKWDTANGLNALHYAIIFKKKEIAEALLNSGASVKYTTRGKISPLQLAILGPNPFKEAIELLTSSTHGCMDVDQVLQDSWV